MDCLPFGVIVLVLALVQSACAQISGAQCLAGFEWTFNSRNQSPCQIAAYLDSACQADPTDAYIAPLDTGSHYVLTQTAANDCSCNTVTYSIISACALCQGDDSVPWTTWNTNCTRSFVEQFPLTIPVGTATPAWAYMDVALGSWNATDAEAFKANNNTEFIASIASTMPSSSVPSSTSTSASSSSAVIPTPSTIDATVPRSSTKKNHVGPIVGGVVGGVACVVLAVLALALWLRRRKAQRRPPSAAFRTPAPLVTTPYTPDSPDKHFSNSIIASPYSATSAGMLYNPDDPTTYPDTHLYSPNLRDSVIFSAQNGYQPAGIRYTGVAELEFHH
ncbi:uncharacterized protein PHACADRAFT_210091 [Phanerochaete carnosa HHB-10118-sp]|uniref:Uncharacterized protein n=1 Tax=Phanerochaete carnosa (strain HHB-10118-sp) TaxID=650164 RepID=K5VRZ3_PHACS|nr:uncharacterized protein PHACADRAFT_210091 [Phanerochaete carnosa HHB-10118-sp]EKM54273.1 hypothetical protein PHACADRAFT_210091 [Phanerochaete carnosa HHB-10118-sp]